MTGVEAWHHTGYAAAREDFRDRAARAGAELRTLPLDDGAEPASAIDVAVLRSSAPARQTTIVSSGLHGTEGVLGSVLQRAWLRTPTAALPGTDLVFLHVLNPYGYVHARRVDADNVDLNRGFFTPEQHARWSDLSPDLDRLLNPVGPRRPWEIPLWARIAWRVVSRGSCELMAAIGSGQKTNPRGLFYTGATPSPLARLLRAALPELVGPAKVVLHLDLHSGLGPWGAAQLFVPQRQDSPRAPFWRETFAPWAVLRGPSPRYFEPRGAWGPWCRELLPDVKYFLCPLEFGTVSRLTLLAALREENRLYHWAPRDWQDPDHPARRALRVAFAPTDEAWRRRVAEAGGEVIRRAVGARIPV